MLLRWNWPHCADCPEERSSRLASFASQHGTRNTMFALTCGEVAMAVFIFALVWGAGFLPRLGEHLGARLRSRRRSTSEGTAASSVRDTSTPDRG